MLLSLGLLAISSKKFKYNVILFPEPLKLHQRNTLSSVYLSQGVPFLDNIWSMASTWYFPVACDGFVPLQRAKTEWQNCSMLESQQPASLFYPNLFFSVPFRTLMTKLVLLEVCSQVSFRCITLLIQLPHNFWIILLDFVYYWKRYSWVSIVPSCNVSRAEHNRIREIPIKPKICQTFLIATLGLSCILI